MNRFRFQQGICYPRRKFRRLSLAEYSLFPDVSGVLLPPQGQGKDVCIRERSDVTAGSMPVKARFRAMNKKIISLLLALALCLVLAALLWWAPCRAQASEVEGIYEKSGAGELYSALDQDTQDLLSQAGIGEGSWESGDGGQLFQALSQLLREKLGGDWYEG